MKNQNNGEKPKKNRFPLLSRLYSLLRNKAPLKQYYLEIGVYFIKKGCSYKIGQIVGPKKTLAGGDRVQLKAVTDVTYFFKNNKIQPTIEKMVVKVSDIEKGR